MSPLDNVTLEIISTGLTFENLPISVPHVSEFAAATDAKMQNIIYHVDKND